MQAPESSAGNTSAASPSFPVLWIAPVAPARDPAWAARHAAWLAPSEAARLDRIRRPERRAQFLAGHVLLRRLVAAAASTYAPAVRIDVSDDGRPTIAAPGGWQASLAHSGEHVAALLDRAGAVPPGVDLEWHKPGRDILSIVAAATAAQADSADDAYRIWAQREAEIKAGPAGADHAWRVTWHGYGLAVCASGCPATALFALDAEAPPCEFALPWTRHARLPG